MDWSQTDHRAAGVEEGTAEDCTTVAGAEHTSLEGQAKSTEAG
jgi:hypothetical protein